MNTGIYIDDTGTPGQRSKSKYDSGDWKTWVAMILKPDERIKLELILIEICSSVKNDFGISEFHFTEIFSGKGLYRKLPLKSRLKLFSIFGEIYKEFNFPIIVQSLTSDDIIRNKMEDLKHLKIDSFDFSKNSDLALWFLLKKSCDFIKENNYPLLADFFVDAGRQKPNTKQKVSILNGITLNSELTYSCSEENVMIQFIDFIAFSVNRMRWIAMNEKKSELDIEMLTLISNFNFDVVNLKRSIVDPNKLKTEDYDNNLRRAYDKNGNLTDEVVELIKSKK